MSTKMCGIRQRKRRHGELLIISLVLFWAFLLWKMPAETEAAGSSLKKPVIVQIVNGKSGKLSITWNKVSGASGYELYRAASKKGKYKKVKQFTSGKKVSYTDTKLENGKKYYYKLRAYKKKGKKKLYSAWSTVKSKQATKNVQNTASRQEFYKAASTMVQSSLKGVSAKKAESSTNEYITGRLLVGTKKNLSFEEYHPKAVIESTDHLYVVQFQSASEAKKAADKIEKTSGIAYVEGDSLCGAAGEYTTSSATGSWGTRVLGTLDYAGSLKQKNTDSIKVAVIDSGVSAHPLLNGRMGAGYNFVEGNGNTTDKYGHGTHVAGIIADNTQGLNITILPVKVLNDRGVGSNLTIGNGIKYAVSMGAKVINISIAGMGQSDYLDQCIQDALNKGVSVVVSAGNGGDDTKYYTMAHRTDATIVVGAVDESLSRWSSSNYGKSVDLVAPGVGIPSCSNVGSSYVTMTGTSMAAPHISAIVAMLRMENPGWNPSQTESWLKNHTRDLGKKGRDSYYGCGIPDLESLMQPTAVDLSQTALDLTTGQTFRLLADVTPSYPDKMAVKWSTSNSQVVTVDENGNMTANGPGTAVITAVSVNGLTAECVVTVRQLPAKVELDNSSIIMEKGKTQSITAALSPENVTERELMWTSSNEQVVSVDHGILTAHAVGWAEITVTTVNDLTASCEVTVLVYPEQITVSNTELTMEKGKTKTLTAEIQPADAVNTIEWRSSNEEIVSVENGVLTANGVGKAEITATTVNNLTASCEVTVLAYPEQITISDTGFRIEKGKTKTLTAEVEPADAVSTILWQSSDETVVSVEDGVLTGTGVGKAVISAVTVNGMAEYCTVESYIPLEKMELLTSDCQMKVGDTDTLQVSLKPADTTENQLSWSSSNEKIVWVDEEGHIEALSEGSATITVTSETGTTAECKITVQPERAEYLTLWRAGYGEEIRKNSNWYVEDESRNYSWFIRQGERIEYEAITNYGYGNNDKYVGNRGGTHVGNVKMTSSDESVAVIDETEGMIIGVLPGIAVITATQENGVTAQMQIEVWEDPEVKASCYLDLGQEVISFSDREIVCKMNNPFNNISPWWISTTTYTCYQAKGWQGRYKIEGSEYTGRDPYYDCRYGRLCTTSEDPAIARTTALLYEYRPGSSLEMISPGTTQIKFEFEERIGTYKGKSVGLGKTWELPDNTVTVTVTE